MAKFKTMNKKHDTRIREKLATLKIKDIEAVGQGVTMKNIKDVKAAIEGAKSDPKIKDPYGKVGLVGKDLVFRIKHKKGHYGEADILLIKNFRQIEELAKARVEGARKAWEEMRSMLEGYAGNRLDTVNARIKTAKVEIKAGNAAEAIKAHGAALNFLKSMNELATAAGYKKQLGRWAKGKGVRLSDLEIDDAECKRLKAATEGFHTQMKVGYKAAMRECAQLEKTLEALDDTLDQVDTSGAEKTDPEYQRKLKEIMSDWKSVVTYCKQKRAAQKTELAKFAKFKAIADKTVEGNADALIKGMKDQFDKIADLYHDIDSHIQGTIRLDDSTFSAKATAAGLTVEDRRKFLQPMTNRAFALNYQAKADWQKAQARGSKLLRITGKRLNHGGCMKAADEMGG